MMGLAVRVAKLIELEARATSPFFGAAELITDEDMKHMRVWLNLVSNDHLCVRPTRSSIVTDGKEQHLAHDQLSRHSRSHLERQMRSCLCCSSEGPAVRLSCRWSVRDCQHCQQGSPDEREKVARRARHVHRHAGERGA